MTYFKNLDGLRAVAALAVIFYHFTLWFPFPESTFFQTLKFSLASGGHGGGLGVTFFFMLSGFLITYLLFEENVKNGSINIIHFYIRRVLRIWPLYYFTLILGFILYPLLADTFGFSPIGNTSPLLYSVFAANFDNLLNGIPKSGILGVQWSVAIEEQFYLVWPLLFYVFNRRSIYPILLLIVLFLSELFYLSAENWMVGYYHLFGNMRFLAFGALLAYLCYFKRGWINSVFKRLNRALHFLVYLICILLILFQETLQTNFQYYKYLYHLLPFLFFGFVILEQCFSPNSFLKIGRSRLMNWLGKISYGLYLTHMIAIYCVMCMLPEEPELLLLKAIAALLLTIGFSACSYYTIESWFLSLKKKFTSSS